MTAPNPFLQFWTLGYRRLVPIVPPGAPLRERSSLNRKNGKDVRGKAPGIKGDDGKFYSFDWSHHETTEHDLHKWAAMGCGVGIRTGNGLAALDIDILDAALAVTAKAIAVKYLGAEPFERVGRAPKALYPFRTDADLLYSHVEISTKGERIEVLADGKQFVADGTHPVTGKPYEWTRGKPSVDELPHLSSADVAKMMEELRAALPATSKVITEGGGAPVDQAKLRGELERVRRAVKATPNNDTTFPSREDYRDYGYAIKAALVDWPNEAYALWEEWGERWETAQVDDSGNVKFNAPGTMEADWAGMKPPFRVGAGWVYDKAIAHSDGAFTEADKWFDAFADKDEIGSEDPFEQVLSKDKPTATTDVFPVLDVVDIINRPPPVWLVGRHIPEKCIGFIYSEPGAGKSFIALDIGLSIAYGRDDWNGDPIVTDADSAVLYIAPEGSFGFRNRMLAWFKARGLEPEGKGRFKLIEKTVNFMRTSDIGKLVNTVRKSIGLRPCLIVVDTVSRALPGADENLQKEMTMFVDACDALRDEYNCAVLGIHHAGVNGNFRGSTVLRGAGDFVFKLERKEGAKIGNLRCKKMKDGPDGWSEPYRFDVINLDDGQSSFVVERDARSIGPSVVLTPSLTANVLAAIRKAWDVGTPWTLAAQAQTERRAVKRLVTDFDLDAVTAEATLTLWEASGLIKSNKCPNWDKESRRKLVGLEVTANANEPENEPSDSVFS